MKLSNEEVLTVRQIILELLCLIEDKTGLLWIDGKQNPNYSNTFYKIIKKIAKTQKTINRDEIKTSCGFYSSEWSKKTWNNWLNYSHK